jgi:SAM-dependent methyltransferase
VDGRRTKQSHWDDYWNELPLPAESTRHAGDLHGNAILDVLDRYLPRASGLSAAELGGAPGQYLAYVSKEFGYAVTCVDYSIVGCQKTVENFELLGIQGAVIQADLFSDEPELPLFDVVYSLGLIEHFADRGSIVGRHVRLVKPGGYLVLGVPNLRGIHGWFFRRLAPTTYATHEIGAMDLGGWSEFERRFALKTIFKGYIGGFEPRIFCRIENRTVPNLLLLGIARGLRLMTHTVFGFVRRVNGPYASGYAMAVYRTPHSM